MIPEHCRQVGVKKVDFELNEEEITKQLTGKKWYTATQYLILHNNDDWAVCKIEKVDGFELFRELTAVEIVSLPEETAFVEDPAVDVLETVPPEPPKLLRLAEKVVSDGKLTRPILLVPKFIRVDEMARNTEADTIVFPCRTSKLMAPGKKTMYLDELPPLEELSGDVILMGCSLSDRIFKSHYHRKPELVNICPADHAKNIGKELGDGPVLLKCCKLREKFEIEGNLIKVPWGTTTRIIEDALNEYFEGMLSREERG